MFTTKVLILIAKYYKRGGFFVKLGVLKTISYRRYNLSGW